MRCDEIQERYIDLLYRERGTPPAETELTAHVRACAHCRNQLMELQSVRALLSSWKDEPPFRTVTVLPAPRPSSRTPLLRTPLRYLAVAAGLLLVFLALANLEISWNRDSFTFRTHLLPGATASPDTYTKSEMKDILKRVIDESENRQTEMSFTMMQRMLETIDREREMDLLQIRNRIAAVKGSN